MGHVRAGNAANDDEYAVNMAIKESKQYGTVMPGAFLKSQGLSCWL